MEKDLVRVHEAWGTENIDANDVFIPKLLIAQTNSEVLNLKNGIESGDFYDTVSKSKIHPVEVVVFKTFKTWQIMRKAQGKSRPEYVSTVSFSPENANWKWTEGDIMRNLVMNFYVLLVENGVLKSTQPYLLPLSRTSLSAGKNISTKLLALRQEGKPAAGYTFLLSTTMIKDADNNKYYVANAKPHRPTTSEEIESAKEWFYSSSVFKIQEDTSINEQESVVQEDTEKDDLPF
jgi:hypothetical protein